MTSGARSQRRCSKTDLGQKKKEGDWIDNIKAAEARSWVVAVTLEHAVWFNHIEDGFNVARFIEPGIIPEQEYQCNQDSLDVTLTHLILETN
jgi:hypothetical protein